MNVRIWSEQKYQELGRRPRVLIVFMGMLLVILGTTYIGLLPGWSAGIDRVSISQPSVLVEASYAWFLVDAHGIVRGAIARDRPQMLPKISGIDSRALLRQEFSAVDAAQNGYELATLLLDSDDRQLHGRDLRIDFSDPQNIVATFHGTTIHFGSNGFREKWDRVRRVRGARTGSLSAGHELDLRFPNTVIVRKPQ
jgi:hypothetical protein|tara:strand:- start:1362 stop:1949 length:588 start_codon:yes stop_codon:yes gene_type:complete